jgi:predicted AAA+ superfamily ATPase
MAMPIIVDEIQKAPAILDAIHWLTEEAGCYFILCGSSARAMKKIGVNMLGGRAVKYNFYPLAYPEFKVDFNLLKIFNNGLIPRHYLSNNAHLSLKSYIEDYLIQEIQTEGAVRNLDLFSRFMDSVAFGHGEMLNYTNIARDCGIAATTMKEYYNILVDTLIGHMVRPYSKKVGRDIITSSPKFYFFDVGIPNKLMQCSFTDTKGSEAGRSIER